MLDFTECIEIFNNYKGSEKKKTIIYNNKKYLVKFPDPIREKNKNISYINNAFSEYVGSNIFRLVGFATQNTILGKYIYNGKEKIVCGCEDFTDDNNVLYEFESLALSTNPDKKIGTELKDILEVIEESKMIDTNSTKERFWDMFVIDAFISNNDRNEGNWGLILNKETNDLRLAPVFDNGASFYNKSNDDKLSSIYRDNFKFKQSVYDSSISIYTLNGKQINPLKYIENMNNNECNKAILRIIPKININKIISIFEEIPKEYNGLPVLSEMQKTYYLSSLEYKYNNVLIPIYNKLKEII